MGSSRKELLKNYLRGKGFQYNSISHRSEETDRDGKSYTVFRVEWRVGDFATDVRVYSDGTVKNI